MCCRTSVFPLDLETAITILTIGRFQPVYWRPNQPEVAVNWERAVPDEGAVVTASISGESLDLNISPAISAYAHHFGKRVAAGVYFEIAAKYAEKVSGEIIQRATVAGCKPDDQSQGLLLARYPSMPLDYERVCPGFRAVILGEAAA
jgi:hypothetical protein